VKTVRAVGPNIGFIFVYSFVSPSKISYWCIFLRPMRYNKTNQGVYGEERTA
jgi:hypothetical protein